MNDLVQWLRAQLDEDEAAAASLEKVGLDTVMPGGVIDETGATVFFSDAVYAHLLRLLDPARVLLEVKAKRRIIGAADEATGIDQALDQIAGRPWERTTPHVGDVILHALAAIYADRPGYREEWRPTA